VEEEVEVEVDYNEKCNKDITIKRKILVILYR